MNNVNKTLYIPLYGKAAVSKKGLFIHDPKAEEIWQAEGFALTGKARSKWLAYYMGIRSAVFDDWVRQQLVAAPDAVVLHLGCGMDSRCLRVKAGECLWYDVDFPQVIAERQRYYTQQGGYRMLGADLTQPGWLDAVPAASHAVVVLEGITMYLPPQQLQQLLAELCGHFEAVSVLMDCYTTRAAKASKYKNPINTVGVTQVYGLDDPAALQTKELRFVREQEMTPARYIDQLQGMEKRIFRNLYAGRIAQSLYRMYEFRKG